MEIAVERVDCTDMILAGEKPEVFIQRTQRKDGVPFAPGVKPSPTGIWYVPTRPIFSTDEVEWVAVRTDPTVRVPLFPQRSKDYDLETMVGSGILMGVKAMEFLPEREKIEKFQLFLGNVYRMTDDLGGYQYWVGMAFRCQTPPRR